MTRYLVIFRGGDGKALATTTYSKMPAHSKWRHLGLRYRIEDLTTGKPIVDTLDLRDTVEMINSDRIKTTRVNALNERKTNL